ncbi:hypothetical protein EGI32_02195 [Ferruginibacter sp. HRS2-29]|nr:hypothetical protein [Ferruginibacter sp. HRS2-29]
MSAGLHTGAANVSIPLFDVAAGGVKMSLALSYSTNGVKVNDIASRVGLGWNLIAGGSITRTIHDEADGDPSVTWKSPPDFGNAAATYDYAFYANKDNYDTERDEYSFSVNGMSGKFFMDENNIPRMMSHSNIKIEKSGKVFTLTDGRGTRYIFGDAATSPNSFEEYTVSYTTNGIGRNNKASQTGWFLRKVETPEGDLINFSYLPVTIETIQGPSQSMIVTPSAGNSYNAICNAGNPCVGRWTAPMMNEVKYTTSYLTGITTSSGLMLSLTYSSRGDLGGDKRLDDISISQGATSVATALKRYHFEYESFNIANDKNQRFYLKKLYTYSTNLVGGYQMQRLYISLNTTTVHCLPKSRMPRIIMVTSTELPTILDLRRWITVGCMEVLEK